MVKRFAVIGLGYFGRNIARELTEQGAEVIAMDQDMTSVEDIKDSVAYAVRLDSTDEKALRNQGLEDLDAVIVSIGEQFDAALLTCVLLLEFGCKHVIAKSTSPIHTRILKSVGVHDVISPDQSVAERLALSLMSTNVLDTIPLSDLYSITQLLAPQNMVGKSLKELELRRNHGVNLITIKRASRSGKHDSQGHIIGVPGPDTVIEAEDVLVLMGETSRIKKLSGE